MDNADLLTPAAEQALVDKLDRLEQRRGPQVVIVTVTSLQGRSIEDFGLALGNGWGIGDARRNDGVLLIIAPIEHKVRIEVGRGLERVLTNQDCAQIIEQDILPPFRKGKMQAGIEAGASRILSALDHPSQGQVKS
ncbi:TPM domain-containing protein [Novosphingobium cyanobacteriorum]|uniref:TPM domain-containing protein n=1 Tax=Novosphingobium cyanobacteriorum TaxID=3024215 RepID=A0ABT6CRU9_9SPHN|nr:TPM domain-containing protein [Novosphingobium cyanobacteriorum]MDF8335357.1 TPM domain-containing protein [Novosphingobium cyanobacteriorum]